MSDFELLPADAPKVHIISNTEISLTECGKFLAGYGDTNSMEPQPMASGSDVAVWDNAGDPEGYRGCSDCWKAYIS